METVTMKMRTAILPPLVLTVLATAAAWLHAADEPTADELIKTYGRLESQRYYRHGSTVYETVVRFSETDPSRITPSDEFVRAYYESRWDEVAGTLAKLPGELADKIYNRMLEDLTGRNVPVLTLDDFLGLADACPGEMSSERIAKLGLLLRIAVAKEQELWLRRALEKGTRRLGMDGKKRLDTGRILIHAGFDQLARKCLPDTAAASRIEDDAVREEVLAFLATQEELDELREAEFGGLWKEHTVVLGDPQADSSRRQSAADALVDLIEQVPISTVEPAIRALVRDDAQAAMRLALALGKRTRYKRMATDVAMTVSVLRAQKSLLLSAAAGADLAAAPWNPIAVGMADRWIREVEHTIVNAPGYQTVERPQPFVAPEDLLDTAPDGAWAEALPVSLRERIDVCLSKVVLVSDRIDDAARLIVDLAGRNREAGASLAEEYVKAWAHRHDPEIPAAVRKQYNLAEDARIIVTPIMMERNIDDLARIMDLFREHGVAPRNVQELVGAFDVCYSNAEAYRRSHIEKVFGPVDAMDEEVFVQMVRKMTGGLATTWRQMDVQEQSGTRRTKDETLAMVREGYQAAIEMVDRRAEKQPDSWRTLMLGGSLSGDWGDFEYYQQLAAETNTDRTEVFREKNNLARDYFARAAEAYARQVPKLGRGKYVIDVYLAWFHSLLGIGSNGELNLSKPLDRAAIGEIREAMRGLPGDAAKTHVDKLARYVDARMEDTENPLHEQLKYKYLAGSLVITAESPFSFQANSKVAYYDELLDELRLATRVDGPNTIRRDHEFGIILSVHHTEAMGRMADFGKYLTNETPASGKAPTRQPIVSTYRMGEIRGRRDELEMNIREALSLFFDIRSIAFSPTNVRPRPTDRSGWEETILAYIHAKAKDASVDKIPRIQMSLDLLDMTGPISVSAESAETMIKMTDEKTPPRPFWHVDLTETLDPRELATSDEILIEVNATACGLLPELDELVDIEPLRRQLPVARIEPHEGTVVRQVESWADSVHAVSERRWTVALDASSLNEKPSRIELALPCPKVDDVAAKYQTYVDMDLVDLESPMAAVGQGPAASGPEAGVPWTDPRTIYAAGAAALAVVLLAAILVSFIRRRRTRPLRARDVFHVPTEVDGFVVVQLLRSLGASDLVRLTPAQRGEIEAEIDRIQRSCFANGQGIPDEELRAVARRWIKTAC
jgi:hypothetical protein